MLKYHYQTELGVAFYNKKIYYFFIHLSHTHTMRKVLAMRFRWCRVYPTLMGIKVAFVVIDMVVGSRLAMIISVCLGSHFLRFSCCVFLFFFFFFLFFHACSPHLRLLFMYGTWTVAATFDQFSVNSTSVYCSWTHKFHFLSIFSLKMGPTTLFTHLKIILLQ